MAATAQQDMGRGSVRRWMLQLALPAVVAQVINLLYNIVDRIYIGHLPEVGATALTGVGLCMPILMLLNAFAMLCGAGGAPRAAIAMGQQDNRQAERIMGNCFSVLVGLAVVLTIGFYTAAPQLLTWFGASSVTLPYALAYTRIYVLGSLFVLLVMGMNPFVTTQGFAKFSMLTTVIGAVCNIVLDPILIFGFNMGVRGAAIATVASQGVSTVWVLRFLTGKRSILKLRLANLRVQPRIIVAFWALVMLLPEAFVRIFNNDPALVDYTVWAMRIYMLGIFSTGFQVSCQQSFVALGQAKISLLLACLRKLILLIPLIFLLPHLLPDPVFAVFLAEPVSDILAAVVTVITFLTRFDKVPNNGADRRNFPHRARRPGAFLFAQPAAARYNEEKHRPAGKENPLWP